MAEHNEMGQNGESLAEDHLRKKGYKILEKNWRMGQKEADIIARDDETQELVIVEVKTRRTKNFGDPEFFVNRTKQKNLIFLADGYVTRNNLDVEVRFDIIGILLNQNKKAIHHIQGAFTPRW